MRLKPGAYTVSWITMLMLTLFTCPVLSDERDPDPRVVFNGVRQTDLKVIPYSLSGYALSVRKAAADGTGAPQIGLDPNWPNKALAAWERQRAKYPEYSGSFDTCVTYFKAAIDQIKAIAPLTRRPTWDHSIDEINAAIRQAKNLINVGDECMKSATEEFGQKARVARQQNDRKILQGRIEQDRAMDEATANATGPGWGDQPEPQPDGAPDEGFPFRHREDPTRAPVRIPGGYDPCANPHKPPGCPSGPPLSPSVPREGNATADRRTDEPQIPQRSDGRVRHEPLDCRPLPADFTRQLIEVGERLAEMSSRRRSNLSVTDEFFFSMASGLRHELENFANRIKKNALEGRVGPTVFMPELTVDPKRLAPMVPTVVRYLNDESSRPGITAELLRQARAQTDRARREIEHDPGFAIGSNLGGTILGECNWVPTFDARRFVSSAVEEGGKIKRAADKLGAIDEEFLHFVGNQPVAENRLRQVLESSGLGPPRYNINYGEKNCFWCIKASIYERETGTRVTAPNIGPIGRSDMIADLRETYGKARPAPPGVPAQLRQQWHEGVPLEAPGPSSIVEIFKEGGVGSDGYLFVRNPVRDKAGDNRWTLEGHAYEIHHDVDGVKINDPQSGNNNAVSAELTPEIWRNMELYGVSYYPVHLGAGKP
jgi:hypothetical protein